MIRSFLEQALAVSKTEGKREALARIYRFCGMKLLGVSFYQKPLVQTITRLSVNHRTFIDIGASIGSISGSVAPMFKKCLAVEPLPDNLKVLKHNLRKFSNCVVFECALSDKEGSGILYLSDSNSDDNSIRRRDDLRSCITVLFDTLDNLVALSKAEPPYCIKIDVQGCEPLVFRGADKVLREQCTVISEFWPYGLERSGYSALEYVNLMRSYGFSLYRLSAESLSAEKLAKFIALGRNNRWVTTDLLFVKSDYISKQ